MTDPTIPSLWTESGDQPPVITPTTSRITKAVTCALNFYGENRGSQ